MEGRGVKSKGLQPSRRHGWSGALAGNASHGALVNGPLTKAECFWGHRGLGGVWTQAEDAPRA